MQTGKLFRMMGVSLLLASFLLKYGYSPLFYPQAIPATQFGNIPYLFGISGVAFFFGSFWSVLDDFLGALLSLPSYLLDKWFTDKKIDTNHVTKVTQK
ncbi:hypothetical protein ACJU26_09665 [Acidithiobacillus sp. M4-SHS-6]|uniref:hypothetical protein n=1 Tax=Acidithiobacillus sp. M4-SHS-6 TaxID=3383024 RepID=UPI0039BDB93C